MRKKIKRLEVAKKMPPLYHSLPGEEFGICKSEAVKWLIAQPEILGYLFDKLKDGAFITYDKTTGKWQGVDYK